MTWHATWRTGAAIGIGLYWATIRVLEAAAAAAMLAAGILAVREILR